MITSMSLHEITGDFMKSLTTQIVCNIGMRVCVTMYVGNSFIFLWWAWWMLWLPIDAQWVQRAVSANHHKSVNLWDTHWLKLSLLSLLPHTSWPESPHWFFPHACRCCSQTRGRCWAVLMVRMIMGMIMMRCLEECLVHLWVFIVEFTWSFFEFFWTHY